MAVSDVGLLRDQWVCLLSRYRWDWFCTFTFRTQAHPETASKSFRFWVAKLNRSLYGRNWYKHPDRSVVWVRALEWQRRNVIHYHALLASPEVADLNQIARRSIWAKEWNALGRDDPTKKTSGTGPGFALIERARNEIAVNAYISKYVIKGGEIDVSPNLYAVQPEQQGFRALAAKS